MNYSKPSRDVESDDSRNLPKRQGQKIKNKKEASKKRPRSQRQVGRQIQAAREPTFHIQYTGLGVCPYTRRTGGSKSQNGRRSKRSSDRGRGDMELMDLGKQARAANLCVSLRLLCRRRALVVVERTSVSMSVRTHSRRATAPSERPRDGRKPSEASYSSLECR